MSNFFACSKGSRKDKKGGVYILEKIPIIIKWGKRSILDQKATLNLFIRFFWSSNLMIDSKNWFKVNVQYFYGNLSCSIWAKCWIFGWKIKNFEFFAWNCIWWKEIKNGLIKSNCLKHLWIKWRQLVTVWSKIIIFKLFCESLLYYSAFISPDDLIRKSKLGKVMDLDF